MVTPLIDGDVLLYEIGFSCQPKTGLLSWDRCEEMLDKKIALICDEVRATTPPKIYFTNTPRINSSLNKRRKYNDEPLVEYVDNFRNAISTTGYKAGRVLEKPFYFYSLLEYMLSRYDCVINEQGLEADDMLCIDQINNAKEFGVKIHSHAGDILVDFEDWLKYHQKTFIIDSNGYVINDTGKGLTRKVWSLHREIMGNPDGLIVDHINGNKLDNRKYNLRVCTTKENVRNSTSTIGSSSYKGVVWDKERGLWLSQIKVDKIAKHLGRFKEEVEAAKAYDEAAKFHFGEFARLNLEQPYVKPFKETIICSRDKDVRQCPLAHYSWECGKQASIGPIFVNPMGELIHTNAGQVNAQNKKVKPKIFGTGHKFFYYQLLTGDVVDTIKGAKGYGPVHAFNLLKDLKTEAECFKAVSNVYKSLYGDNWKEWCKENANLIWMIRELNEDGSPKLWRPPFVKDM